MWQSVVENCGIWFGNTHDVTVDDATHRRTAPRSDLTDAASIQDVLDLTARIAHHADRNAAFVQGDECFGGTRQRMTPQVRGASAAEHEHGIVVVLGRHPDTVDIGTVVGSPIALVGPRSRLRRHAGIVSTHMALMVSGRPVVIEQGLQHHRIWHHQYSTGIEEHGIKGCNHAESVGVPYS